MAADYKLLLNNGKRVRFYDGQFLQDQDFIDEQKYHLSWQTRHQRLLHVSGIVEGLTLYPPKDTTRQVRIRPGMAIDADGRQILLTGYSTFLKLESKSDSDIFWVYIAYHQQPVDDPNTDQGVEENIRWEEIPFCFVHAAKAPLELGVDDKKKGYGVKDWPDWNGYLDDGPPTPLLLAKVTVDNNTLTIDESVRRYSGLRLPGPGNNETSKLRADASGNVGLWLNEVERLTVSPQGKVTVWGAPGTNKHTEIGHEGNESYVNTVGNGRLDFQHNGNNKMVLTSNGDVGIGQEDPDARLHIINEAQDASGNTLILGPTNNANLSLGYHTSYSWIQAHGNKPLTINPSGNNVGIGTTEPGTELEVRGTVRGSNSANNYTELGHGGSHGIINTKGAGRLEFQHDGNTQMTLSDDAKLGVGIGSANPASVLHIKSSTANSGLTIQTGDNSLDQGIAFQNGGNAYTWHLFRRQRGTGNNANLHIAGGLESSVADLSTVALFAPNGNVGIGTTETTPAEKLEVNGRIKSGTLTVGAWPVNDDYVFFGTNSLDQSNHDNYALLQAATTSNNAGRTYLNSPVDIRFRINNGDKMVLANDGKVGIGTDDPLHALDVEGRLHLNNGVIQRGGDAITNTSDLGLYSRSNGSWIRIVTNNAPIKFFTDDGIGSSPRLTINTNGTLDVAGGVKSGGTSLIKDIRVAIHGSSRSSGELDDGWYRLSGDLNKGSGGKYIYLEILRA